MNTAKNLVRVLTIATSLFISWQSSYIETSSIEEYLYSLTQVIGLDGGFLEPIAPSSVYLAADNSGGTGGGGGTCC